MSEILRTEGLMKSFGELTAVNNVSLQVGKGELLSIIGPNGAGKTTFFNLISRKLKPDRGKVFFEGEDISGLSPHKIVSLGITRSFQISSYFPRLTCFENVMSSIITVKKRNLRMFSKAKDYVDIREEVSRVLERVGLGDKSDTVAAMLAHGDRKRLDLAVALGCHPKLMLLDEPTCGMSPEETDAISKLIQEIRDEEKVTIVFTEHDMRVVFSISDRITVLHQGEIIASGKPQEVRDNKDVIEAYLGEEI
jgi:branched-chain amino acid transport system ATP-binding protein